MSLFAKIQELKQKRANLIHQARDIINQADEAGRAMTAEENQMYNKIMDDIDKLTQEIENREKMYAAQSLLDGSQNEPHKLEPQSQQQKPTNPRASKEYMEAFKNYVLNGNVKSALQVTDDSLGGFIVAPEQFVNDLLKAVDDMVLIRQWATKFTVNAKSLGVPSLDSNPNDFEWTSEIANVNEDNAMKFGKRELTPHPLSKLIKVSMKLLRSAAQDPEQIVRDRMAYVYGITHEKAFLTGDGVNKPLGVFTASNDGISTARDVSEGNTSTAIKFDGLIAAKYKLKAQYLRNARWLFHRDAIKQIAMEKDNNGQYIWKESVRVGEPDTILGLPVYMSEFVPNTFTSGKYVGILGDFSFYWIADALDFGVQRLNELFAANNQIGFIGRGETDGMPVLEEAFVRVKLA